MINIKILERRPRLTVPQRKGMEFKKIRHFIPAWIYRTVRYTPPSLRKGGARAVPVSLSNSFFLDMKMQSQKIKII